ncbi:MAG: B12-binding domain-containing radical SAM protein [Treponema sp.]|nr:B12-binding domain-containing radical SAM protein [Treponema sp.]
MADITLITINAKWIHPSLALRLLKANLGSLEDSCEIIEFALRQPLIEKTEPVLAARPRILGISVSIWNHLATIELLKELEKAWAAAEKIRPVVVLGGPEVSHLPSSAEIFNYADHIIRGEGETPFRLLCENLLQNDNKELTGKEPASISEIKTAYRLYTDEDIAGKLIYVESSRGCPFRCEFCLSALDSAVREFPLDRFFAEMDILIQRGVKTFKFLDRSINININRIIKICIFFLEKIDERIKMGYRPFVVHFEMVPSNFPAELRDVLMRFPAGTLRLEIGIQTLNPDVSARIGRVSNPDRELEALRFLRWKTNAIIHADLIAGLPGEDLESFGRGFDRLWSVLGGADTAGAEIQLGILKLLPGAPVSRHSDAFGMRYNLLPPYEIEETSSISAAGLQGLKNFARFWELIVNRGLVSFTNEPVFEFFMGLSYDLFNHFSKNWGIDRKELQDKLKSCGL